MINHIQNFLEQFGLKEANYGIDSEKNKIFEFNLLNSISNPETHQFSTLNLNFPKNCPQFSVLNWLVQKKANQFSGLNSKCLFLINQFSVLNWLVQKKANQFSVLNSKCLFFNKPIQCTELCGPKRPFLNSVY